MHSTDVQAAWLVARFHWQNPTKPGGGAVGGWEPSHCALCQPYVSPDVPGSPGLPFWWGRGWDCRSGRALRAAWLHHAPAPYHLIGPMDSCQNVARWARTGQTWLPPARWVRTGQTWLLLLNPQLNCEAATQLKSRVGTCALGVPVWSLMVSV